MITLSFAMIGVSTGIYVGALSIPLNLRRPTAVFGFAAAAGRTLPVFPTFVVLAVNPNQRRTGFRRG